MINLTQQLADADRGRSTDRQFLYQERRFLTQVGAMSGYGDLVRDKRLLEQQIYSRDFSGLSFVSIEFGVVPPMLCTGLSSVDYDLSGRHLQYLAELKPADAIFFATMTMGAGGAAAFSWLLDTEAPSQFVDDLLARPESEIVAAVTDYLFLSSDNLCISPEWWDSLHDDLRAAYIRKARAGTSPEFEITPASFATRTRGAALPAVVHITRA